ncbi:MAG: molecular chaperone GrpE [Myxococcota bacterium]|jgi:molecular chaperone GrpE
MVHEPEVEGTDAIEPTLEAVEQEDEPVIIELVTEPDPLEAAQEELKSTQARLRSVSKAYTDLQAEMQSFKKRAEGQAERKSVKQTADLVRTLLEPVENLRRSLENPGDSVETLIGGLKLVVSQFDDGMTRVGLRQTGKVGERFDPRRHEALAMTPVTERSMDGMILMVQTTGYMLGDNMLQPAQVIVGKHEVQAAPKPQPEAEAETEVIDAELEEDEASDDEVDA